MFTGIITDIGELIACTPQGGGIDLRIATHYPTDGIALGASIACNGVCLTVTDKGVADKSSLDARHWFAAHASAETVAITTVPHWQVGTRINLERALKMGDELGGHLVQGHVDGVGTLRSITPYGDSYQLAFTLPAALSCFVAPKGSIALNGISLTVNQVTEDSFAVMIIPHTWQHTTLSDLAVGAPVNLEIDLMARYLQRQLELKVG